MESKVVVHFFTCSTVEYVARVLREVDMSCMKIYGIKLLEVNIQFQAYEDFKTAEKRIVLCSDCVGLGLYIGSVKWIVKYEFPDTPDIYLRKVMRPALGSGAQSLLILNNEHNDIIEIFENQRGLVLQKKNIAIADLSESRFLILVEERVSKNKAMKKFPKKAYIDYLEFVEHILKKYKLHNPIEHQVVSAASFGIK